MSRRFVMGLDVGGSKGRSTLVDVDSLEVVTSSRAWAHPIAPGTAGFGFDLDTNGVLRSLAQATRESLARASAEPREVLAVATTSMRHGTVVIDGRGEVLFATPTRDARAAAQGFELAAERGGELHRRTGHWPAPLFTAPRLLWIRENIPDLFARARAIFGIGDWLQYRLSGAARTEPSLASETILFDLERRTWSDSLIASLGFPRHLFPEIVCAGEIVGKLTIEAADLFGLAAGTPVVAGGGDTQCGLLGAGAVEHGHLGVIAGTTMPVQLVLDRPIVDAKERLWTSHHVVPGRWVLESNGGSTGEMLEWMSTLFHGDARDPVASFVAEASRSVPGALGIVSTLGTEIFDGSQLNLPVGHLTLSHMIGARDPSRRRHVSRSVLEGMAYGARANIEQVQEVSGERSGTVRLAGGMSRSGFFAQLLSDAIGARVEVTSTPEASAYGAALCAAVGAGIHRDLGEGARRWARIGRFHEPDAERRRAYDGFYEGWTRLRAVRSEADALAASMTVQSLVESHAEEPRNASARERFRPKILVTASMDPPAIEALSALGEVRHSSYREAMRLLTGDDLVEALEGRHVFITEIDVVDVDVLARLPELRVVVSCRGNAVNLDIAACTAFGIPVLTTPGRNADAVADLALAFMLMLARKLPEASAFLREPGGEAGDIGRMGMAYQKFQGLELWHKTIGLIGFGSVGRKVAERLRPFGARILVQDPMIGPEDALLLGAELVSLDELLASSDFVSLHAAVTDGSKPILGAGELAQMRKGAFLVNTARALLVDESSLVEALESGRLGGAALDVFSVEPPASDHPLLALPSVIATPHVGGNTIEVSTHQGALVCEDLARLIAGERPLRIANPEVLDGFRWSEPRKIPVADEIERLRQSHGPGVSDLEVRARSGGELEDAGAGARGAACEPGREIHHAENHAGAVRSTSDLEVPARGARRLGGLFSGLKNVFRGNGEAAASNTGPERPNAAKPNGSNGAVSRDLRALRGDMARILERFVGKISRDDRIVSFAQGKRVTVRYEMTDIELAFYTRFDQGAVSGAFGEPPARPEVTLKMKASVLDGLFTGRVNGAQAAMSGKLSFTGDTLKAMSIQRIQKDLNRLYAEARTEAGVHGEIEDVAGEVSAPRSTERVAGAPARSNEAARARDVHELGDERDDMVRVVEELYGAGLITSTGGNLSVRVAGAPNEVWITPNHAYKGGLRPEMMVRIDLEGNQTDSSAYTPSSEKMIHCAILKNHPEINAVIHSHAPQATILGLAELPFLPISTEATFIGEIPRVPFIMPGTSELAEAVASAIRGSPAVIMQNHGLVVAGPDLRRAADITLIVEQTAEKLVACHALGRKPPVLPDEIVATLKSLGEMIA